MAISQTFQQRIQSAYKALLAEQDHKVDRDECIKIDLHCHDLNSDVTDELLGRILRFPETWLTTEELVRQLRRQACNGITITNHNNARSCWQLLDKGEDILVGAEFSCRFEEFGSKLHVLAYGFTPDQETKLNKYRKNLYRFLTYAAENDIPTVLPHPLYFSAPKSGANPELFQKLVLMFERFEVLNGQRDVWQNLLTWEWLNSIDEETIEHWQKKHNIKSSNFCSDIYKKRITGGTDDHMGLFAGTCGSYLHIPGLKEKQKDSSIGALALEALKHGDIYPYGSVSNHEKLNIAFIDYLSQVALYMKEPGLLRMFLHQGSLKDKLICLGFSNAMQELKRHRFTLFFFKTLHEALKGKRPSFLTRFKISPDFKPLVRRIDDIAKAKVRDQQRYQTLLENGTYEMFSTLNNVVAKRIKTKSVNMQHLDFTQGFDTATLINKFEIPTHFRALFEGIMDRDQDDVSQVNLSEFLDTLSFPVLASSIIAAASMISTRVLNNQRDFINRFAKEIGKHEHPKRALWLTDTLRDKNGVSSSLSAKLRYIQQHDLDIDFLVCHDSIEEESHLKVVRPVQRFSVPSYPDQMFHFPDILQIKKIFIEGGYDRIICSTEALMGLVTLYLKVSMAVPVYFFMHTDWMEFFIKTTSLDPPVIDRIRRILRAFYLQYDGIYVMNQDHHNWLTGPAIGFDSNKVFETAHWVDEKFQPQPLQRHTFFDGAVQETDVAILYAGRLSEEKGVFELPELLGDLRKTNPNVKLLIAGKGPAEQTLREKLPDAVFLGWVEKERMPTLYSQVDLLILPSRFDTFGNVILEAMSCGTAVAAYAEKGPKSIIKSNKNGILAQSMSDLKEKLNQFIQDPGYRQNLKIRSLIRAKDFTSDQIMESFVGDIGLFENAAAIKARNSVRKTPQLPDQSGKGLKKAIGY